MALVNGVTEGDGDFIPYIKYDARAGRWYNKIEGADDLEEITDPVAVWDLANASGGWIAYFEGTGPDYVMDNGKEAPRPSDKHKRGFKLVMFSDKNLGGAREFSSTAKCVVRKVNEIFDQYEAAPERSQGKLPAVACKGVTKKTAGKSDVYEPNLEIVGWADRPAELTDTPVTSSATTPPADDAVPPPPSADAGADLDATAW